MNITQVIDQIENVVLNHLDAQNLVQQALNINAQTYQKIKSLKGKGQKSVCSATIPKDTLFYKCFDCCREPTHVYCQACYKPEKHQNHVITYHYSNGGCCDCGDILIMKKESFCQDHQANNMIEQNPEQILGERICQDYRNFIQVAFSLLISKIEQSVQYPPQFFQNITSAQDHLNDEQISNIVEQQTNQYVKYQSLISSIQRIYTLIMNVLQDIITDNITISLLTSKYLQQPIDKAVSSVIPFYHIHGLNTFQLAKISQEKQICNCTILELYVKFNGFLCNVIPSADKEISEIFYELHVDEKFKPYLCRQILKYFNHLYKPIQRYKFVTKDNSKFKIVANQYSYSDDNSIGDLIKAITKSPKIHKIMCKHDVLQAGLFGYFYQFQGHIVLELLKMYKETKSNKCYYFFKIFSERMIQIPLCNDRSQILSSRFDDLILSQFSTDVIKNCLLQIEELLGPLNEQFKFIAINPQLKEFQKLQNESLLIYALTRTFPCSVTEAKTFNFLSPEIVVQFINNQIICIQVISGYRKLMANLVEVWRQQYNQNKVGLLNILRIVLHYFINNFINSFEIISQDVLKTLLSNQIIADRNFIVLLSIYLSFFNESQEAYDDLLSISGDVPYQFKQVMQFVLKRALLNYIIFSYKGNEKLYKGQIKLYKEHVKLREVALEQVDVAYVQMYAFIFREQGLNDIIDEFQSISEQLSRPTDSSGLICRIAQSDYDYFQCQGDIYGNDLSEQVQKGLTKLFQTIFYAQTFYTSKDMITLLKSLSYDSSLDLQKIILSSCELNKDNEQLQLKKTLLPPQYEPVFAKLVISLKEKIDDKLKTQNDQFKQLFGSSLETELQTNTPKSTLTYKRKVILQAIAADQRQLLLSNLISQIQQSEEKGDLKNIALLLENSSTYVNLLFQSNKHFGSNPVILQGLKKIQQISFQIISDVNLTQTTDSIYSNFVMLLDEQSILQTQQLEDDAHRAKRSQLKKQQLLGKFKQMGQGFAQQIQNDDTPTLLQQTCSLCSMAFKEGEVQYKAVLLQFTNFHKYELQVPLQGNQQVDLFSVHATCCGHLFHSQCLKNNKQKYTFGQSSYLKCPSCFQPYNFPFMNPQTLKRLQNEEFLESIEFFFRTLPMDKVESYAKYTSNDGLKVNEFVDELFSCVLCNLLLQLLGDIKLFYQKEHHLFLQDVIYLLRLKYQHDKQNIIDTLQLNMQQVLFKLLKVIQQTLISNQSIEQFQQQLQYLLQQNRDAVFEMVTQKQLQSEVNVLCLPYEFNSFKARLRDNYIGFFTQNFRTFLIKYNLAPCEKKKCKFLPKLRFKDQEQQQYICLICWKKMCSQSCGQKSQNTQTGNLIRHASKRHQNKTMYLQISSSQLYIMVAPLFTICNVTLFQNLIGQQPELGYLESAQYEIFKLNLKAVDLIVDIVSGEKFIAKMFADTTKVLRKYL